MIFALLNNLKKQSFTGIAHIKTKTSEPGIDWRVYLNRGKLIWAGGGIHDRRSWQRYLNKYCSKIDFKQVDFRHLEKYRCVEYCSLGILLQRNLVTSDSIKQLINFKIVEILFDLFQYEKSTPLELRSEELPLQTLIGNTGQYLQFELELERGFKQMQQVWLSWIKSGFEHVFPDDAPKIKNRENLKQSIPTVVYQNFVKLLDGRRSLRDLAAGMNKDLLLLTKSIYPYVQKDLLELVRVPDLNRLETAKTSKSQGRVSASGGKQLIACIDDSPQICMIMNQIIAKAGYDFLGIQQPIQAVPTLIGVNPKMIFLDIGMPIINGYEVCTQIRRVSKLQEIPIVMLTGNDGVFDRVKAKVCGASDFLSKPIEVDKIIQTIDKFSAPNAPTAIMTSY